MGEACVSKALTLLSELYNIVFEIMLMLHYLVKYRCHSLAVNTEILFNYTTLLILAYLMPYFMQILFACRFGSAKGI